MAGRGRGRGTSTFTQEQLQTLGCTGKDLPQVSPTQTFPALLSKPIPFEESAALSYQLLWKEVYLSHMRDSPYFVAGKQNKNSDVSVIENNKKKVKLDIPWHLMPSELKPNFKRKNLTSQGNTKRTKTEMIEKRLKALEEKEHTTNEREIKEVEKDESEEENEDENETLAEEDDEMDEDNDYGNNYFDNGEAFNDEDDNLDDGPIY